jgi:hypothetical protein
MVGAFLPSFENSSYKTYYVNYSLGKTVEKSVLPTTLKLLAILQVLAKATVLSRLRKYSLIDDATFAGQTRFPRRLVAP